MDFRGKARERKITINGDELGEVECNSSVFSRKRTTDLKNSITGRRTNRTEELVSLCNENS